MNISDLLESIRKFGLETVFRRYYSEYRAQVVDTEDEQNRNRVKVKVPDIFGDVEVANWAEPNIHAGTDEDASDSESSGKFCGPFFPPKVGDWIWVTFEKGHPQFPKYRCEGWIGKEDRVDEFEEAEDWTMINPIFISRYGIKIYVDETEDKAKVVIKMNSKSQIELSDEKDAEKITIEACNTDQESRQKLEFDAFKGKTTFENTDGTNTQKITIDGETDDVKVEMQGGLYVDIDGQNDKVEILAASGSQILLDGQNGKCEIHKADTLVGDDGLEPMVLFNKLSAQVDHLVQEIKSHYHPHGMGPTGAAITGVANKDNYGSTKHKVGEPM